MESVLLSSGSLLYDNVCLLELAKSNKSHVLLQCGNSEAVLG